MSEPTPIEAARDALAYLDTLGRNEPRPDVERELRGLVADYDAAELRGHTRDEVERLRGENSKLRDVLGWVETQCPGKCAGVCFDALSGEQGEG